MAQSLGSIPGTPNNNNKKNREEANETVKVGGKREVWVRKRSRGISSNLKYPPKTFRKQGRILGTAFSLGMEMECDLELTKR